MMTYPKIDTLYDRDNKFKVIEGKYRRPEFGSLPKWDVAEKVHGTNIRVVIGPLDIKLAMVFYTGRTDRAQLPVHLLSHLQSTYTMKTLLPALKKAKGAEGAVLYMEGYGYKIQEGGNYCGRTVSTRLFDVFILDLDGPCARTLPGEEPSPNGWWLDRKAIESIAESLGINTVPYIGKMKTDEIVDFVKSRPVSVISGKEGGNKSYPMEGVVAKSNPLLLLKSGDRLIWKLKGQDF